MAVLFTAVCACKYDLFLPPDDKQNDDEGQRKKTVPCKTLQLQLLHADTLTTFL